MKFLTDENVAASTVVILRKEGHDVKDIKEERLYGTSDKEILRIACLEDRILISHDKDFLDLFSFTKIPHKGMILLRCHNQRPTNVQKHLLHLLHSDFKNKIESNLVILTETKVIVHHTN